MQHKAQMQHTPPDMAPRTLVLPTAHDGGFDYLVPTHAPAGSLAEVSLRGRTLVGMVTGTMQEDVPLAKLKSVTALLDVPAYNAAFRGWLGFVAQYAMAPLGAVMALTTMNIARSKPKKPYPKREYQPQLAALSEAQTHAATAITETGNSLPIVLDGVTGSGKTEVYFHTIADVLQDEHAQVLVLLPEIGLTHQWLARFEAAFGAAPAVWHSGVTPAKRKAIWHGVTDGSVRIVVGARSALFLPFANLKLIVVDEEHDSTYKQDDGVLYQARDMAVARAKFEGIPIILASATPSLETCYNIAQKRYREVRLQSRHGSAGMPDMHVIDMRADHLDSGNFIGETLRRAMMDALAEGDQVLLYLNRRGYAPLMLCRGCGHRFMCPSCSAWLVTHNHAQKLQCHHCGHSEKLPDHCPACDAEKDKIVPCGPGVERIEEEVRMLLPELAERGEIRVFSSDTGASDDAIADAVSGRARVLIGTQMLAKGHHFPNLTVVGVIDADLGLAGGDLRASEHTFQLLQQIAGRAGRESKQGRVLLQSYEPSHAVIRALSETGRDAFLDAEMTERKRGGWPPYGMLAAVILDGPDENAVRNAGFALIRRAPVDARLRVLGPAPAPLSKLRGQYRYRLLVKATRQVNLQQTLNDWLKDAEFPRVRVKVDVNPYYFL